MYRCFPDIRESFCLSDCLCCGPPALFCWSLSILARISSSSSSDATIKAEVFAAPFAADLAATGPSPIGVSPLTVYSFPTTSLKGELTNVSCFR